MSAENLPAQMAKTLGSTSIRHRSDTFASDRCLTNNQSESLCYRCTCFTSSTDLIMAVYHQRFLVIHQEAFQLTEPNQYQAIVENAHDFVLWCSRKTSRWSFAILTSEMIYACVRWNHMLLVWCKEVNAKRTHGISWTWHRDSIYKIMLDHGYPRICS